MIFAGAPAFAEEGVYRPTRYALAAQVGNSYSTDAAVAWFLATGAVLIDYERLAPHPAPDELAFKLEGSAGIATAPERRAVLSVDMLANYSLDALGVAGVTPYIEAGIGLIYTDFRRDGQGLRFNFNPVAGAGYLFRDEQGTDRAFAAVRFHHISNGGTNRHNTGINSALFMAGVLFR